MYDIYIEVSEGLLRLLKSNVSIEEVEKLKLEFGDSLFAEKVGEK